MARKSVCKKVALFGEGGRQTGIRFDFENGNSHQVDFATFKDEIKEAATAFGFTQTLGDSYSQSGGNPDVAEREFLKRLETLSGGEWSTRGKGSSAQADEDLARALAEVTKQPLERARERVAEEGKEWKDARRKHAAVAAVLARIKAERLEERAEGEDVGDLL